MLEMDRKYSSSRKKRVKIKYKNVAIALAVLLIIIVLIYSACSAGNDEPKDDTPSDVTGTNKPPRLQTPSRRKRLR